jgi:hypothetical protein
VLEGVGWGINIPIPVISSVSRRYNLNPLLASEIDSTARSKIAKKFREQMQK